MGKKKKGGCPGGICGRRPATPQAAPQNKYQAKAQKKIDKVQAKADVAQAKAQAKVLAEQPTITGAPPAINPGQITGPQGVTGGGLQALSGNQSGALPPLAGGQQSYNNNPITYTQPGPGFFSGTNANISYYPQYEPEQQYTLDQLLRGGLGGIRGLQELDFDPIAERQQREFQTQTVPSLAERFTALGGGQRSGAFKAALGQAGSDLQSQLAALRSKYGLAANEQRLQQALPQLQFGLQPRRESVYTPRQSSGISNLFGGLGQGIGQGISSLARMGLGI